MQFGPRTAAKIGSIRISSGDTIATIHIALTVDAFTNKLHHQICVRQTNKQCTKKLCNCTSGEAYDRLVSEYRVSKIPVPIASEKRRSTN